MRNAVAYCWMLCSLYGASLYGPHPNVPFFSSGMNISACESPYAAVAYS